MKPGSVHRNAHALFANAKVTSRIEILRNELEKKCEITRDRVLKEYGRIAFLNTHKMYDETGRLKNILDMDEDTRRGIASINLSVKGINIKLADKKGST